MTASYGAKYITTPVPEGVNAVQELTHVWHMGTRGPDHIKSWRTKIVREFPELADAIERIVGGETSPVVLPHEHAVEYTLESKIGHCAWPNCNYSETHADNEDGWHDPTHGRIDRDIQEHVDAMNPTTLGTRAAIESTLQTRRDHGLRVLGKIKNADGSLVDM